MSLVPSSRQIFFLLCVQLYTCFDKDFFLCPIQVVICQEKEEVVDDSLVFSPIVTATCRAGVMTIKVETLNNFVGVAQSRDHRKPECSGYGENTKVTFLRINMLAEPTAQDYCGVFFHEVRNSFISLFSI